MDKTDATPETATESGAMDSILSKLSLKGMGCQPKKGEFKPDSPARPLARIFGIAKKHDVVSTAFGDSPRIIGEFEGVNLATGEAFKATKAFLPNVIAEIMVNALDAREEGDEALEFAIEIGAQYSEKGGHGYAYTVKPLVKTKSRDALSHLREVVKQGLPQLAAPAADTEAAEAASPGTGSGTATPKRKR